MIITIAITVVAVAWIMVGLSVSIMNGREGIKGSCGGIATGGACACGRAPGDSCGLEDAA